MVDRQIERTSHDADEQARQDHVRRSKELLTRPRRLYGRLQGAGLRPGHEEPQVLGRRNLGTSDLDQSEFILDGGQRETADMPAPCDRLVHRRPCEVLADHHAHWATCGQCLAKLAAKLGRGNQVKSCGRDECRADYGRRRAGSTELLGKDRGLDERRTAASVGLADEQPHESGVRKWRPVDLGRGGVCRTAGCSFGDTPRQLREFALLVGQSEVHSPCPRGRPRSVVGDGRIFGLSKANSYCG